jgi:hypothetical protein
MFEEYESSQIIRSLWFVNGGAAKVLSRDAGLAVCEVFGGGGRSSRVEQRCVGDEKAAE